MFNEIEKNKIKEIREIEDLQRATMTEINNILSSILDLSVEGEEQRPDLKEANDRMKQLIHRRLVLFNELGITPESNLPNNIEKHLLS
jgi:hypothetical protein